MSICNDIRLIGRPVKNIELKYTAGNGTAKASFTLASERRLINKETGKKEVSFIPVIVWGKSAEFIAQYGAKGKLLSVRGEIVTRSYDKDGERKYVTEVVAEEVTILEWNNNQDKGTSNNNGNSGYNDFEDMTPMEDGGDIPF